VLRLLNAAAAGMAVCLLRQSSPFKKWGTKNMCLSFNGRLKAAAMISLVSTCLQAENARAVDLDALDLMPAPAGTNALLSYSTFTTRQSFVTNQGQTIEDGTKLDSYIGILRYVHYADIGGFTVAPQVLLPYGRLYDGSLGGVSLNDTGGFADPIVAAPFWFVNNQQSGTSLAIVPYLFVPLGKYDAGEALNLGENRWKFDLQLGGTQDLGHGFLMQASADVMWYGPNSDAMGNGIGDLRQDNTYQAQIWLTYAPPKDPSWKFSLGYSKYWGGDQSINGVENGIATESDQLRLQVSKFVTPTFQVQGLVQRDLDVQGGFREDLRTTVRFMKLF
jgi:hypothetical protein